jgi:hypothetical protein
MHLQHRLTVVRPLYQVLVHACPGHELAEEDAHYERSRHLLVQRQQFRRWELGLQVLSS